MDEIHIGAKKCESRRRTWLARGSDAWWVAWRRGDKWGASRTRARGELKGGEEWKRLPLGLPRAGGWSGLGPVWVTEPVTTRTKRPRGWVADLFGFGPLDHFYLDPISYQIEHALEIPCNIVLLRFRIYSYQIRPDYIGKKRFLSSLLPSIHLMVSINVISLPLPLIWGFPHLWYYWFLLPDE